MRKVSFLFLVPLVVLAVGCSGGTGTPDAGDVTMPDASDVDVPLENDVAPPADTLPPDPGGDEGADLPGDLPEDPDGTTGPDDSPADAGGDTDVEDLPPFEDVDFPPRKLAFAFARPAVGEPVDAAEVTAFTKRIAAVLHQTGYFRWLLRTSTGVDASTGRDDYLAWHNDARAVKADGKVTFRHEGHEHNMWIPSAKVLSAALGAYLHTGDWEAGKVTEQYCKGLTAVVKGFVKGDDDPAPWLMARAIFPMDHEFTLDADAWHDDGRVKNVAFTPAKTEASAWNAATFPWPGNPAWGDIWVTNMRSKDDVRAITRAVPFLQYVVADAKDAWVRDACAETLETMTNFHKDIVDHGYFIRTKDRDGVAYALPCDDNKDLGSYACYTEIDPGNECCARMATDMIAYGERRTNDCGSCTGSIYDMIAPVGNIYNINIIWDYHMAGVLASLVHRQHREAYLALAGLADRIDEYLDPTDPDFPGPKNAFWPSRMALLLVESAAVGLPLTAREVRMVHHSWDLAAEDLLAFPNWDLWDESVPDGTYDGWTNWDWWVPNRPLDEINQGSYRPVVRNEAVPVQWFATLFEYCMSPFRNPAGASFVDCEVLRDPATWGQD
jgi:hypothetical protein